MDKRKLIYSTKHIIFLTACFLSLPLFAQTIENTVVIDPNTKFQTIEGFGASLAYYDNWLTAHPNKAGIYDAIFNELSLDILRVRNAYDYDTTMIDRVSEFVKAAEKSLGKPIKILSTSWGPPAYLKNNNDRKNGGTLKYVIKNAGVEFDYSGFADWWNKALNEYNNNDIFPTYISIQNEPDYAADWESCLFEPFEEINDTDTIAGYNKALEAVYNMIEQRSVKPKILGPETVGVGYNSVQNYVNALNTSYIYGIAHHLYHGVDANNPWSSTDIGKVGDFHPEIPHFQTEFSRGDWFSLGGLMYKSFNDENVVAYLYWNLVWNGSGLVNLESPWNQSEWTTEKGYIKTKEFYAFKQYSAFIHPEWKRISANIENDNIKPLAFINPTEDTISLVLVNRSDIETIDVRIECNAFSISGSEVYRTSDNENCVNLGELNDSSFVLPPKSITTVRMNVAKVNTGIVGNSSMISAQIYPNPFSDYATIKLPKENVAYDYITIIDSQGRIIRKKDIKPVNAEKYEFQINGNGFEPGLYYYNIESVTGKSLIGKFIIKNPE